MTDKHRRRPSRPKRHRSQNPDGDSTLALVDAIKRFSAISERKRGLRQGIQRREITTR
jgi:hypothetical protein